ncbi:hypothetical protein PIB30_053853 [Stylosanthes scabra]|uniref:Uncharacterized protein n=1 Tax=Stylosanthes scabra TaxID=79078 RepID=A0ABU6XGU2_9FABA|nr:hypothetical protein [Stylosanthes scabra]
MEAIEDTLYFFYKSSDRVCFSTIEEERSSKMQKLRDLHNCHKRQAERLHYLQAAAEIRQVSKQCVTDSGFPLLILMLFNPVKRRMCFSCTLPMVVQIKLYALSATATSERKIRSRLISVDIMAYVHVLARDQHRKGLQHAHASSPIGFFLHRSLGLGD